MTQTTVTAPRARSYGDAVRRLVGAQKSAAGVPAYLRWVNRPLGRRLAAAAFVLRATPNQLTILSLVASLAGVALLVLAPPAVPVAVAVAFLMALGYALDSADGQLARLSGSSGRSGEYLDHVADAFRQPVTHLGVAVALLMSLDEDLAWLAASGVVFATVSSVWFFSQILAEALLPAADVRPGSGSPAWVSLAKLPLDPGALYLLLLLLPWTPVFLAGYLALLAVITVVATTSMWRKYSALRRVR